MLRTLWRDHSLSITLLGTGIVLMGLSIPLAEGTWFDLVSMVGGAFFTGGIINLLSGPLRERNKPDE